MHMGMYNTVRLANAEECPRCHQMVRRAAQFHYGAQTLRYYEVGERLEWGEYEEGEPGHRRVAVQADELGCSNCGYNNGGVYDIFIENDVIASVALSDGKIDYDAVDTYYWVVLKD